MHGRKFKMQHSYIYIGKDESARGTRRGTKEKWDTVREANFVLLKLRHRRLLVFALYVNALESAA